MHKAVAKLMERYGSSMTLIQGETEHPIRGFLQETRSKSHENTYRRFSLLGETPMGMFVYLGPAEPMAHTGDQLIFRERRFELRRAEPVLAGDQPVYCWGMCIEKGEADIWAR